MDQEHSVRYDPYTGELIVSPTDSDSAASAEAEQQVEYEVEDNETQQAPNAYAAAPQVNPNLNQKQAKKQAKQAKKQAKKANKSSKSGGKSFLLALLGAILGSALTIGTLFAANSFGWLSSSTGDSSSSQITIDSDSVDYSLPEAVAKKALPSVVSIDVYTAKTTSYGFGFSSNQTGNDTEQSSELSALGSGVIIDSQGYILTNYHVIEGESKLVVHFDDDSSCEAEVVGTDESSDLAVIKVEKDNLTAIEVADSSEVTVGEWVMAIGSPYGNDKSVTAGIVSALYRSTSLQSTSGTAFYINMIQTDAAINPGNSGGALVNSDGKLIGINAMIDSSSGSSAGVGFAIPSNYAMNIANQLIKSGKASHPYLGCTLGSVDAATQSYYGVDVESGAYVGEVIDGSPADEAGIEKGDVIVKFDGETVSTSTEAIIDIRSHNIGDTVKITVNRDGKEIELEATLASDGE